MWKVWTRATKYGLLPSQAYDPEGDTWHVPYGSLAQWMFDEAVTWFGITIENALAERIKVQMGKDVQFKPKYTLIRLLNPAFRLPKPLPEVSDSPNPWSPFMALVGKKGSGVKRWRYNPPEKVN